MTTKLIECGGCAPPIYITKPIVRYRSAGFPVIIGISAWVYPLDHPDTTNVSNTKLVKTSTVINVTDSGFETLNTKYINTEN